jgi:Ca2+-transporting ATPase
MISSNVGEVASIFLTGALGMPEGMVPVQLLWVNLVTDGPPATALGFNPPDIGVMSKPPRDADEALIDSWVLFRYMVVGLYVGCATVGAFAIWFTHSSFAGIDLSQDGHSTVSFAQLRSWRECPSWGPATGFAPRPWTAGGVTRSFDNPCDYFGAHGKAKASTLSLSVLVVIEMMNALNALSEDGSLLSMPPWVNPLLLLAIAFSIGVHCVILYVPRLADIFQIVPLSVNEWLLVLLLSAPVVLLEEVLKMFGRFFAARALRRRLQE